MPAVSTEVIVIIVVSAALVSKWIYACGVGITPSGVVVIPTYHVILCASAEAISGALAEVVTPVKIIISNLRNFR